MDNLDSAPTCSEEPRFDGAVSGEPFCACGRVVSQCDGSRRACRTTAKPFRMHDDCDNRGGACKACRNLGFEP